MHRPAGFNAFEFAVVAGLRAAQLARGCTPRVKASIRDAITAQVEVAERKVSRIAPMGAPPSSVAPDEA